MQLIPFVHLTKFAPQLKYHLTLRLKSTRQKNLADSCPFGNGSQSIRLIIVHGWHEFVNILLRCVNSALYFSGFTVYL
jgi:hypothetical protein